MKQLHSASLTVKKTLTPRLTFNLLITCRPGYFNTWAIQFSNTGTFCTFFPLKMQVWHHSHWSALLHTSGHIFTPQYIFNTLNHFRDFNETLSPVFSYQVIEECSQRQLKFSITNTLTPENTTTSSEEQLSNFLVCCTLPAWQFPFPHKAIFSSHLSFSYIWYSSDILPIFWNLYVSQRLCSRQ